MQTVDAAERPEVEQDDLAPQLLERQPAGVEPAASFELRRSYSCLRHFWFAGLRHRTWSSEPLCCNTMNGWLGSGQSSCLACLDTIVKAPLSEQLALTAFSPSRLTHELTANVPSPALLRTTTTPVPATASKNTTATTTRLTTSALRLLRGGGSSLPGSGPSDTLRGGSCPEWVTRSLKCGDWPDPYTVEVGGWSLGPLPGGPLVGDP